MRPSQLGPERYSLDYGVETPRLGGFSAETESAMDMAMASSQRTATERADRQRKIKDAKEAVPTIALAACNISPPAEDREVS